MPWKRDTSRDANMTAMYRAGLTLEQIGARYGFSRERARQILRKIGVGVGEGGIRKRRESAKKESHAARDRRYIARYGLDYATVKMLQKNGASRAWAYQRRNARMRNIEWHLTLAAWWGIWQSSGKWEQRGRRKGNYVMARLQDSGPYAPSNVWVCEVAENIREARAHSKPSTGNNVHCLFPGYKKPWVAKAGRMSLGYYATREEADKAKADYLAANGLIAYTKIGRGRGWTFVARCTKRPYQVHAFGKTHGYYATEAEARAVYLAACEQHVKKQAA